ncbi:MAG: hypothetical protein WAW23_00720 [Candidatus Methanoperedens sp.]
MAQPNLESWFGEKVARYGVAPYLECHSRGDTRFSPFYARVNGKSIEAQYHSAKVFEDGSTGLDWRQAKGKRAVNAAECSALYERLWRQYIAEHPELLDVLKKASGLRDMFSKIGNVNQAEVLWGIRNRS